MAVFVVLSALVFIPAGALRAQNNDAITIAGFDDDPQTSTLAGGATAINTVTITTEANDTERRDIVITVTGANVAPPAMISAPATDIQVISTSPATLAAAGSSDPDTDDTLTYAWNANQGTLSNVNTAIGSAT